MDDTQKQHWEKAFKGNLSFLAGMGGIVSLHDFHTHSESTYLIGHQRFSEMLEEFVEKGYAEVGEDDDRKVTLTEKGRNFI
jgi:hypothetical protein